MIYRSDNQKDCRDHTLVLKAAGIPFRVHEHGREYTIWVAADNAARSLNEFASYARENHDWTARPINEAQTLTQHSGSGYGVYGYVAVLILVSILARDDMFGWDWFEKGKTHAALIQCGHWWRTITALTLHSDLAHLVSNVVIGSLFGYFVGLRMGSGLAWLSIVIAGSAGNYINAWLRYDQHTSIGASTAVFAMLGILAASAWTQRRHIQTSTLKRWTPIIGGVLLLSWLGTGGMRTDVLAHVSGFFSGILLGVIYETYGHRITTKSSSQSIFAITSIAIVVIAWLTALFTSGDLR